jgi:hypothetical protein
LIATLPSAAGLRATLRRLNAHIPPDVGGNQERQMEMQKQAIATTTTGIAAELLSLALHALVAGAAAAMVAGSLVVALTVIAA